MAEDHAAAMSEPQGRAAPDPGPEPGPEPVVSILVVSYNTRAMTLDCLTSLEAETRTPHEVVVVDNASTDGSADAIAEAFPPARFPHVRLIRSPDNLGFAAANNVAAKHARARYILLLNPDTVVLDGAVDRLLAFAAAMPHARIWGGRTLFADGSLNPGSCWQRMTLWNLFCRAAGLAHLFPRSSIFNNEAYGGWQRDQSSRVSIVTGCFFLIERGLWERLGGFNRAFFMYGEEADLCLRARAFGADPHITPEACIIHHGGASEKVRADKMVRLLAGKATLINRHLPAWQQPLAQLLLQSWPLSRYMVVELAGRLSRSSSLREKSAVWAEIWRRRPAWKQGYDLEAADK